MISRPELLCSCWAQPLCISCSAALLAENVNTPRHQFLNQSDFHIKPTSFSCLRNCVRPNLLCKSSDCSAGRPTQAAWLNAGEVGLWQGCDSGLLIQLLRMKRVGKRFYENSSADSRNAVCLPFRKTSETVAKPTAWTVWLGSMVWWKMSQNISISLPRVHGSVRMGNLLIE